MDADLLNSLRELTEEQLAERVAAMSDSEVADLQRLTSYLDAPVQARQDLARFVTFVNPLPDDPYNVEVSRLSLQPHHRMLCEAFTEVANGECLRLAISMPPQHGKSTLAKGFLTWHEGKFPWKHILFGTYNEKFAWENGEEVRELIEKEETRKVFPRLQLRGGSRAKDHMVTADGGKISFLGRGGSGTGRPADGLLIDDPLKDAKEAESKTIRDDCWNWYTRVANTRCHMFSWQIIIATRWSDDDIIARLTDPKNPHYDPDIAGQWKVINLPAIMDDAEVARILGKQLGEALWPDRFGLRFLDTARKLDEYGFNALYMGRPTPPEGAYYKEWQIRTYNDIRELPKRARHMLTGDLAVSPDMHADKSCVGLWWLDHEENLYLHPDLYWDKKSSDESVERIIEMGSIYHVEQSWWEKGQLDKAVGPFLRKRMLELCALRRQVKSVFSGKQFVARYFPIEALPVAGSKGLRSTSIRGRMAQGKVFFPAFAPWWPAAKEQMLKFTGSGDDKEDDFCDMIALIGQALDDQYRAMPGTEEKRDEPKVGTLAWLKKASAHQKRERERVLALRGQ